MQGTFAFAKVLHVIVWLTANEKATRMGGFFIGFYPIKDEQCISILKLLVRVWVLGQECYQKINRKSDFI